MGWTPGRTSHCPALRAPNPSKYPLLACKETQAQDHNYAPYLAIKKNNEYQTVLYGNKLRFIFSSPLFPVLRVKGTLITST